MINSTSATPLPTVFQDNQKNEINGSYAAPVFQHNYMVAFSETTFLIDQKIGQFIRLFFEERERKDLSLTGMGSEILLKLKTTRTLTPKLFECILEFYRKGTLSHSIKEDTFNVGHEYHFPLLDFYLNHMMQSSEEELFTEKSCLSPFDKLEIAALKQNTATFLQLIEEFFCRQTVKIRDSHSKEFKEEPVSAEEVSGKEALETDLAKSFINIEKDLWTQREFAKLLTHFDYQGFEEVVCLVRSHPELYIVAIKSYVRAHRYCLDDLIHEVKDESLKWDLIKHIPSVDARLGWFSQLMIKASAAIVKEAVIDPLMSLGRFEEALQWASNSQDSQIISQRRKERMDLSNSLSDSSDDELESFSLENGWVKCTSNPIRIDEIVFDTSIQTPLEFIRAQIKQQVSRFQEAGNLKELDGLGKRFMNRVGELLENGWTKELLVFAIQCYIDESMARRGEKYTKQMREKCSAVTRHGECLHPALMEDLQIIRRSIELIKMELMALFGSEEMRGLLKNQVDLLEDNQVTDALVVCSRRLFQQRFSLREDFIVQEVSNYFQPCFLNPDHWHDLHELKTRQPLMEYIEKRLENAKLDLELTANEMMLAHEIVIRKSIEIANYQFNPLGTSKLDPYGPEQDKWVLQDLKEAMSRVLKDSFRESDRKKMSQKEKEGFKGASLLREIYIQANHAKFKAHEIR